MLRGKADVRMDSVDIDNFSGVVDQIISILKIKLFFFLTLALCSLYFVVTGLQVRNRKKKREREVWGGVNIQEK